MARVTIGQILNAVPGSAERARLLGAWIRKARDPELAALHYVGTTSGDARKIDYTLSAEEEAKIKAKVKDETAFKAWEFLLDVMQQTRTKLCLIRSEIKRYCATMQGICNVMRAYQREAVLLNQILLALSEEERASKIVSIFANFDMNEGIDTYEHKPLVTFNVKKGEGVLGIDLVECDCTVAYQCLNDAKKVVLHLMGMAKAIERVVVEAEQEATEHGFTLPSVCTDGLHECIDDIKGDSSGLEEYSFKRYQELLAEGKTDEAEERRSNFLFPDYSEATADERLYQVQKENFSVWSYNL